MQELFDKFTDDEVELSMQRNYCPHCSGGSMCGNTGNNMKPDVDMKPDMGEEDMDLSCNQCVIDKIGLAQAYIPYQTDMSMMDGVSGLKAGTVFTQLNQPYQKGLDLKLFK